MICHGKPDPRFKGRVFRVDLHGAKENGGEKCLRCHQGLYRKELRSVEVSRAGRPRLFDLTAQSHSVEVKAAHGLEADCTECHRRGEGLLGGRQLAAQVFLHGTNLSGLEAAGAEECNRCHEQVSRSTTLSAESVSYDASACKVCHIDPADGSVAPVEQPTGQLQLGVVDFPHAEHRDFAGGCLACHRFEPGEPLAAVASTTAEARNCRPCHDRKHENIGGGDCDACHILGQAGVRDDPVFTNEPIVWQRPANPAFSHWSPGHRPLSEDNKCGDCHDEAGTWSAMTVDAVPVPTEAAEKCHDCHLREKKRFHWH